MPDQTRVRAIVFTVVTLAIAAGAAAMLVLQSPAPPGDPNQAPSERLAPKISEPAIAPIEAPVRKVFELALVEGQVRDTGDTIRVSQGDQLELRWTSDRPMSLHLHGYDIHAKVSPQAPATMSFKAHLAGRFPVSEHRHGKGHERAVLYLEVHP